MSEPLLPGDPEAGLGWLRSDGPNSDVVLSTRIRLARNLKGFRFGQRADAADRAEVLRLTVGAAEGTDALGGADHPGGARSCKPAGRQLLLERHLVSRELVGSEGAPPHSDAALLLAADAPVSVMVNEEDHLRLQSLLGGFRLRDAWRATERLDDELGARLPFAFHSEFGYLTSCPTNVGTGLRASVLMHLPGLVLTQEIGKVLQGIAQVGLTFRGLYGEGRKWSATSSRSPTRPRWGRRRKT